MEWFVWRKAFAMFPSPQRKRRFAFVLGISGYVNAPPLRNPPNDRIAIANALRDIGYDVEEWQDLDCRNIILRLEEFLAKAGTCDTILLYYSGHGVQLPNDGTIINYIVPADFSFDAEDPVLGLVSLQDVVGRMAGASNKIVFFDACRDTAGLEIPLKPMPASDRSGRSAYGSGSATRSLGEASVLRPLRRSPLADRTFISFAAEGGDVADDGTGELSPFTAAVVRHIRARGLDVHALSHAVAQEVRKATDGRQVPWTNSNLPGSVFVLESDPRPVFALGMLGAVSGFVNGFFAFHCYDFATGRLINPWLANVIEQPLYLMSSLPFAVALGWAAWRWGRIERDVSLGVRTGLLYFAMVVLARLWYQDTTNLDKVYELISNGQIGLNDLVEGNDTAHLIRANLYLIIVAAAFAGMASILACQLVNTKMHNLPRLALGGIIGGGGAAALVLLFVLTQSDFAVDHGSLSASVQVPLLVAFAMIWEGLIGANAGWAFWKHVPKPLPMEMPRVTAQG